MFAVLSRSAACLVLAGFASQAHAAALPTAAPAAVPDHAIIPAQRGPDGGPPGDGGYRYDDRRGPPSRYDDRDYRRYRHPPPGWRRYHDRPWDWRRRGCALIGPVWYCP